MKNTQKMPNKVPSGKAAKDQVRAAEAFNRSAKKAAAKEAMKGGKRCK